MYSPGEPAFSQRPARRDCRHRKRRRIFRRRRKARLRARPTAICASGRSLRAPRPVREDASCPSPVLFTTTGSTFQMSRQYSAMVRSEENFPIRLTLSIDIRVHRFAVSIRVVDVALAIEVRSEVGADHVVVPLEKGVHERAEERSIAAGEEAARDEVDGRFQSEIALVVVAGPVAPGLPLAHLLRARARRGRSSRRPLLRGSRYWPRRRCRW